MVGLVQQMNSALAVGYLSNFVIVQAACFILVVPSSGSCAKTSQYPKEEDHNQNLNSG